MQIKGKNEKIYIGCRASLCNSCFFNVSDNSTYCTKSCTAKLNKKQEEAFWYVFSLLKQEDDIKI